MVELDNIAFELQVQGGVSTVWSEVLKCAFRDIPEKLYVLTGEFASNNVNFVQAPKNVVQYNDSGRLKFRRYRDAVCAKNVTVFHSSYFRVAKQKTIKNIVTVHDFVYEKYDAGLRRFIHLQQKKRALKKATAIICVSKNTKEDLLAYHPWINSSIVHVIYNGVGEEFHPIEDGINCNETPFLLYVGGRNIHKNFKAALELLNTKTARQLNLQLKVVGGGDFNERESSFIEKQSLTDNVIHQGSVDVRQLNDLYNKAYAFIYPSFYEGFGIPPLEAMAAGCPVICSNRSSIPEVVGEAGLLFDPENVASAEEQLKKLVVAGVRQECILKGISQAAKFSWEKTGFKTVALYKKLLEEK